MTEYKIKINEEECIFLHKIVDGEYIKQVVNVPKFYLLIAKTMSGNFEIANDQKLDIAHPSIVEFILVNEPIQAVSWDDEYSEEEKEVRKRFNALGEKSNDAN